MIKECRACKGKQLKYALKIKKMSFVFCKDCTLLQRQDNILYELSLDFSGNQIELDYYPSFLSNNNLSCVDESSVMFFSLKAIEMLLNDNGYKVTQAIVKDDKLYIAFEKLNILERLRLSEKKLKLSSQFSFFLWAVKLKK